MHFSVHDILYSQFSHQHVPATNAAIFRFMLLLQEYKGTNMVSCVAITTQQFKISTVSVRIVLLI
jgi:hypothetical protein